MRAASISVFRLWLLVVCAAVVWSTAADWKNSALAYFKFAGDGKDALGKSPDVDLKNAEFKENTLRLDGVYENNGQWGTGHAIAAITNFSYDHFTFSVDIWPIDFDENAKSGFNHAPIIVGGTSYRWIALSHGEGHLALTLNNQAIKHEFAKEVLAEKKWHNLICSVDTAARQVRLVVDGRALEPIKLADDFKFEVAGSKSAKTDANFTFQNYSNGSAYHGYAANLKVFGAALTAADLQELAAENRAAKLPENPHAKKAKP